jgi:hypothetical protein
MASDDGRNVEYGPGEEALKDLLGNKKVIFLVLLVVTFVQACFFASSLAKVEVQIRRTDPQCRGLLRRHQDRALTLSTLVAQMKRLLLKREPSTVKCFLIALTKINRDLTILYNLVRVGHGTYDLMSDIIASVLHAANRWSLQYCQELSFRLKNQVCWKYEWI